MWPNIQCHRGHVFGNLLVIKNKAKPNILSKGLASIIILQSR